MFVSGGVSGFFLAQPAIDIYLHATYFVVGHFHLVMGVASIFGIFAGTYFWFSKMSGRMLNETLGKIHFWFTFVGAYCIFMPFHYLGMVGNVRRTSQFMYDYAQPLIPVHRFVTIAALCTGAAQLIFLYNLIYSRFKGAPAPDNPWNATSLEWATPSPPPWDNFGGKHPVVYHDPYQYSVEGARRGFHHAEFTGKASGGLLKASSMELRFTNHQKSISRLPMDMVAQRFPRAMRTRDP